MEIIKICFFNFLILWSGHSFTKEMIPDFKLKSKFLVEYSIFKIDIQYISLLTNKKYKTANEIIKSPEPKLIAVEYLRDLDKDILKEAWDVSYKTVLDKQQRGELKTLISKMKSFARDVKKSDKVLLYFVDDEVQYFFNQTKLGVLKSKKFQEATISIWIGEKPVSEEMRAGMLKSILL